MSKEQEILKQYNTEEIKQLLNSGERLVYIDDGIDEIVARYEDLPDIIVDINEKFGYTKNLKVYDYENPSLYSPLLTTTGFFLDKCNSNARRDIIDRLEELQRGEIEIKEYKVINEDRLEDVINDMKKEEIER